MGADRLMLLENYKKDKFGVIHQVEIKEFEKDYASQYNDYGELSNYMAYLRLGYLTGKLTDRAYNILDVGYGNGAFLKACENFAEQRYGYDISDYPVPDGCIKVDSITSQSYDIITFFDSLEHFHDLSIVGELQADYVLISVPNCKSELKTWFGGWKHRRENEHIHHFNSNSLAKMMKHYGYDPMGYPSYFEDIIRKDIEYHNILTMLFEKK